MQNLAVGRVASVLRAVRRVASVCFGTALMSLTDGLNEGHKLLLSVCIVEEDKSGSKPSASEEDLVQSMDCADLRAG